MHPCTEFGVASSKFTFTGGPHVKIASSPLARADGTRQERHPQRILSWYSTRVTCEFGISGCPRLTPRGARKFLVDLHSQVKVNCVVNHNFTPTSHRHQCRSGVSARRSVPPPSLSNQPFGRYARKCLNTQTHKHQPANFFQGPTGGNLRS